MEAVLKKCHFNVVVNGFITFLRTQMLTRCLSATVVIPTVYKSMHFSYPVSNNSEAKVKPWSLAYWWRLYLRILKFGVSVLINNDYDFG